MLPYHNIDPYLLNVGFLKIRWYGLMYFLTVLLTYLLAVLQLKRKGLTVETNDRLRCCLYISAGMLVGSRLGQVLFYNLTRSLSGPWSVSALWQAGMSFYGAFIGVAVAAFIFVRRNEFYERTGIGFLQAMDIIILGAPVGLGLVKIGGFQLPLIKLESDLYENNLCKTQKALGDWRSVFSVYNIWRMRTYRPQQF